MNLADVLEQHARARPAHPAIEQGDHTTTYAALLRFVLAAEANLRNAGVKPGETVVIMLPGRIAHLICMFALARLGAIVHAVDASETEAEKSRAIEGLGVRHVIAAADEKPLPGTQVIDYASTRPGSVEPTPAFATMFDGRRPLIVVQSSGTTGAPKTVILSHDDMWARTLKNERDVGLDASDRYLSCLDINYFAERRRCLAALCLGGTVIFNDTSTPRDLADEARDRNATWMSVTPALVRQFLSDSSVPEPMFPSLKRLCVSSSFLGPGERTLARKRLCPNLVERYGINEAGLVTIAYPEDQEAFPESVGRPIDAIEAQVVDDDDRTLPPGEVGRFRFRASYIPTRYLDDPEASAKAFRGGWYYPGDLAAINEQGYLFLKGRSDDVINAGGAKLYPVEIEAALLDHPAVLEAAVVSGPHPVTGEAPIAFVVTASAVSARELAKHCSRRISRYKVPYRFEFVDELPKNPMGKILKTELRARTGAPATPPGG
ncbi:MAG: acyl--CoA ligase [Proteobacteria bacterium]|nr:acyl--CoA ligase [Pseudomonadota bacterium]